jgi:hypothetical protein
VSPCAACVLESYEQLRASQEDFKAAGNRRCAAEVTSIPKCKRPKGAGSQSVEGG